ncbi:hypothetical protein N8553_02695 [bacterium]|nr:hypothetical protein [bacterium]
MCSNARTWIFLLACCALWGCGQAKYEERLKATSEFYEYMQTMESNLSSPIWERSDLGLKMRLPLPFRGPLPGPELLVDEEGEQFYGPESRHPEVLGTTFPGIVEAWQTMLPGEAGEQVESRIYLLTNHSRFKLVDGAVLEEPTEFFSDLELQVSDVFNVVIPDGEANAPGDNIRYKQTVPMTGSPSSKFIEAKRFSVIRFIPEEATEGQGLQVVLYEHQAGDIQAAVVVIGPSSFSSQFRQRMEMALQTLSVQPQVATQIDKTTGTTQQGGVSGF